MSATPTVSSIMIFFNEERFIAPAVDSVLQQSFGKWELLLVDDGSTDASTRIAKEYAARYPEQIRYIEHPQHANLGTGASRNLGLRYARGKYIAFLDADDIWTRDKLAWEVELLDAHPAIGWLYGQTLLWYSWNSVDGKVADTLKETGVAPDSILPPPQLLIRLLQNEYLCPACGSILMRRTLVEQVGGWQDEFRGQYEDMVLYAKLLLRTPVYVDGRVHSYYRQHVGNSWVADRAATPWRPEWLAPSRGRYLEWLARYLDTQAAIPNEVRQALAFALLPYRRPIRFLLSKAGVRAARKSILPMLKQALRAIRRKI